MGVAFGLLFPFVACLQQSYELSRSFLEIIFSPPNTLLQIIMTAPIFLGALSYALGKKQDKINQLFIQQSKSDLSAARGEADTYKFALEQSAIIAITDTRGVIVHANDAFVKISGYSRGELLGQDHRIINSGLMPKGFFQNMWREISVGKTWRGEICNRKKNGSLYWVDTVIVPFLDARGVVTQYMAIRNEITQRKKMEEQLWATNEIHRAILNSTSYSVVSTDIVGMIKTVNKGAEKMLGYEDADLIDQSSLDVFHDPLEIEARAAKLSFELGEEIRPGFETLATKTRRKNEPDENEWTYIKKDGTRLPVRLSVTCLHGSNGDLVGYLGIANDIAESKKIRDQLLRANEVALSSANSKSEFLANMSHEIRTPMNGVIGMCNLLMGDIQDETQLERLKIIQNCGNTMLDLINDILDFSKLEAGKVELEEEPFPIHETAREIVDLLKPKSSEKGLSLAYIPDSTVPDWVLGDPTRFRQILTNLAGNAIKFTASGGVSITSSATRQPDGRFRIRFSVKDTGIGIPDEVMSRLFKSFSQADASTTRRFGGTGLGLAISKGLCEKMGGELSVESQVDTGSTFSFTLPFLEATPVPTRIQMDPFKNIERKAPRSLRILVAEDNRVNQLVLTGMLNKMGYTADIAANGREVMECLSRQTYHLILMDCHMPDMDGFEATRRICAKYPKPLRPRIVALTASTMQADIDRCKSVGMDSFASKPITVPVLTHILNECNPQISTSAPEMEKAQQVGDPFSGLRIINEETFHQHFEGMDEIAKVAIESSLQTLPDLLKRIKNALEKGDSKSVAHAAHSMKGTALSIHAERVTALAGAIEECHGNLIEARNSFARLDSEIVPLLSMLRKMNRPRSA